MNATEQLETLSNKIADAIVALVKAKDGPVTLLQIEREVPGFAANTLPGWYFALPASGREAFVWAGLTEAGAAALGKIIFGKKVAVQFVTPQPYLLDGGACYFGEDWLPIMLLPAEAANASNATLLARLSPQSLKDTLARPTSGKANRVTALTPHPRRHPADRFSIGDPRSLFSALLVRADAA